MNLTMRFRLALLLSVTLMASVFATTLMRTEAAVNITAATGGTGISADTAGIGGTGAWQDLGAITIAEVVNTDFAVSQGGATLILTLPTGFEFNTGQVPNVSGASVDLSALSVSFPTAATLQLTFTTDGTADSMDSIVIGSTTAIQVRPTDGTVASGSIFRTAGNAGTATIVGITNDSTNFGSVSIVAGAATQLAVTTEPSASTASSAAFAQQPIATVQDAFGNTIITDNSTVVTAALTTGSGALAGTLTKTAASGIADFSGNALAIDLVGADKVLTVSAGGLTSDTTAAFAITPGAATQLAVTTEPSASTASTVALAQQPVVTIRDAAGNTVTGDSSTVVTAALTTGSGALAGTLTKTAASGIADFSGNNLAIDLIGADKVLTVSAGGLTSDTTAAFTITLGAATQLAVTTEPSASTASSAALAQQPVVTIQDAGGNTVTGDSSTVVTATLTTGSGTLAGTVTKTAASGIADFSGNALAIDLVGADKVLTVSAGGLTSDTTAAFAITPGAATQLAVTTEPSASTTSAVALAQQPVVTIRDAAGNTVTGDSSTVVTAALTTGSGTLAGTVTKTAASGVADFSGNALAIDLVGADKVLTVSAGGLTSDTTAAFAITGGAASTATSTVSASPTTLAADGSSTSTITVQLKDASGNNLTAWGDTVVVSTTLGSVGSVTDNANGTYTATFTAGATAGTATISGTLNAAGITDTASVVLTAPFVFVAEETPPQPVVSTTETVTENGGVSVEVTDSAESETAVATEVAVSTTATDGAVALVTVPPDALPATTTVKVSVVKDLEGLAIQAPPPVGADLTSGFVVQAISAAGEVVTETFSAPVALEFTVDASAVPAGATPQDLTIAFWDGTAWVSISSTVVVNANASVTLTAETLHFTLFAVVLDPVAASAGSIVGTLPGSGFGLVTFTGTVDQLESVLIGDGCIAPIFATSGGAFVGFFPTARIAAANAAFRSLFADGLPRLTALIGGNCGA